MNLPHHPSRLAAELRLLKDLGIISTDQLKQLALGVLKEGKDNGSK